MKTFIWNPEKTLTCEGELLARVSSVEYAGCTPGDAALLSMLADISREIFLNAQMRLVPQFVALAYWLRTNALQQLKLRHLDTLCNSGSVLVPRGVALHLPPTNVDTIFVYSWALSVLAGNVNIVRLSDKCSTDTEELVRLVSFVVDRHKQSSRQIFCQYPYGGEIEKNISRACDLRMIWGGDQKVDLISQISIKPDGLSIGFPDRKSISIIDCDSYRLADTAERNALASNLYNDIYWFSQMACGSPRTVVWIGKQDQDLTSDLYYRLQNIIVDKKYTVELGVSLAKRALANDFLAEGIAERVNFFSNELIVARLSNFNIGIERIHGGGFLTEYWVSELDEIAKLMTRKIQTIGHFGLTYQDLKRLAFSISGRGGYRIVPIGQALKFDADWDGVSLLAHLTRRVTVTHS